MDFFLPFLFKNRSSFPAWHPNFKPAEALVGHTQTGRKLFRAALMMVLIASFIIAFGLQWKDFELNQQYQQLNKRYNELLPANTVFLKDSEAFLAQTRKIDLVSTFTAPTYDWLRILNALFENKPGNTIFNRFQFEWIEPKKSDKKPVPPFIQLTIVASLKGPAEIALQVLESYKESIQHIPMLTPILTRIDLLSVKRNERTRLVDFELSIILKPLNA